MKLKPYEFPLAQVFGKEIRLVAAGYNSSFWADPAGLWTGRVLGFYKVKGNPHKVAARYNRMVGRT